MSNHSYDKIIVGAGPVGCAAAAACARVGQRVLLLEADARASRRLAGEWLHPAGAQALRRLGLFPERAAADHPAAEGFAVLPDDGSEPILLPYGRDERGLTLDHGVLVEHLRERVAAEPGVDLRDRARVRSVFEGGVELVGGERLHAEQVVGADGRKSLVREAIGGSSPARTLSHMAGVELRGVELPFEGHGHVLLGGPGPILMYRIGADSVRACLDVPVGHPGARRDVAYLYEAFADRVPASLRGAFRAALQAGRVQWALGRFRPRSRFARGRLAVVGDAAGATHPLTAAGMTLGFADALCLSRAADLSAYAKEREAKSYVPELLASALYQVFMRPDSSAESMRAAVYDVWRRSASERKRTMRLLAGEEVSLGEFGAAFLKVAARASGRRSTSPLALAEDWSRWPAATLMPARLRARLRPRSSGRTPFASPPPEAPRAPGGRRLSPDERRALDAGVRAALEGVPAGPAVELARFALHGRVAASAASGAGLASSEALAARIALMARVAPDADALAPWLDELLDAPGTSVSGLEALAVVAEEFPGVRALDIARVRREARARLFAAGLADDVVAVGERLRSLAASGVPPFHPTVRRCTERLEELLASTELRSRSARELVAASRGLLAARVPRVDLAERALRAAVDAGLDADSAVSAAHALALLEQRDSEGPADVHASAADLELTRRSLREVSRTFARPIEMLPGDLGVAVTCGYLLCRVADTVEDNPNLSAEARDLRYGIFLDVVEGRRSARDFERLWADVPGRPTEIFLCENLGAVMRVFADLPEGMRRSVVPWVAEMTRGMQLYSHRRPGDDGFSALHTEEDLDRYCYYVAGTVGHMLTGLFLEQLGRSGGVSSEVANGMREHAEGFGLALQYTNILKDVTDDAERRWSFIPRTVCAREGLTIAELTEEGRRAAAHRAVAPLFETARRRLDQALEYTLAIPTSATEMRLFCLLPLFMAVRTLEHARGNDAMFVAGAPVKIERAEVEAIIPECVAHVQDDRALRQRYGALWRGPLEARRQREAVVS